MIQKPNAERTRFIISFLAPAVGIYLLFVGVPLVQSFYYAMFRWRGVSAKHTFVGAKNFIQVAQDPVLHKVGINQLLLLVCGGVLLMALGVSIAHATQAKSKLSNAVTSIMLFPQVVSMVVVGIIWRFMWNPSFGLLTKGAKFLNIPIPTDGVTGSFGWANFAILIAFVWHAVGFYIMLFSAGLRNIDGEVLEAAHLDGSAGWHRFTRITWPLLWSVKRVAMVYVVSNVMGTFALVRLLTEGGPDNSTQVSLTYVYQLGWGNSQMGQAATLAVYSFLLAMVLGSLAMKVVGRNPEFARKRSAGL